MQETIYNTLNALLALLVPIVSAFYFCRIQEKLIFKKWVISAILFIAAAIAIFLNYMQYFPKIVSTLIYQGSLTFVGLCSSRDKFRNKIVNLAVFYLLLTMIDLFMYAVAMTIPSVYAEPIINIALAVLLALASYFAVQFIKNARNNSAEERKNTMRFLLIPLAQMLTINAFGYTITLIYPSHSEFLEQSRLIAGLPAAFLMLSCVISIVADIFAFKQHMRNLELTRVEAENKSLEYKNQLNINYFIELKENETELRKIKHDINGCLETMKEIIHTEKDVAKAEQFFDELSARLGNISTGFYSRNSLINAIIINKAKTCTEQNIKFNVEVNIPDVLEIPDTDICRVLTNILDNAIEANMKLESGRFINLSIKENEQYIYLSEQNPYNGEMPERTSKKSKKEHGFGMEILNDFAEKYSGHFKTEVEADTFSLLLVLKNAE